MSDCRKPVLKAGEKKTPKISQSERKINVPGNNINNQRAIMMWGGQQPCTVFF